MKGRPEDVERNKAIAEMLRRGAELEQREQGNGMLAVDAVEAGDAGISCFFAV